MVVGWLLLLLTQLAVESAQKESFWQQSFFDIDGKKHVHASIDTKAVVWIFILEDCPISNAYSPEIIRLVKTYQTKGIKFTLIHSNPELAIDAAKKHRDDYQLIAPIVLDRKHQWVAYSGATVTPEAVVFAPNGERLYCGRIDDRFPAYGKRRAKPTKTELKDALDSIINNKPIAIKESKATGCYIPTLK